MPSAAQSQEQCWLQQFWVNPGPSAFSYGLQGLWCGWAATAGVMQRERCEGKMGTRCIRCWREHCCDWLHFDMKGAGVAFIIERLMDVQGAETLWGFFFGRTSERRRLQGWDSELSIAWSRARNPQKALWEIHISKDCWIWGGNLF